MLRIVSCLIFVLIFSNPTAGISQESEKHTPKNRSPEEIMRYVRQAVALIQEKGEECFNELTDPNGRWVQGDFYIYVVNFNGFVVAHLNKKLVGKNMYGVRDVKGNAFFAQLQEIARTEKGHGWNEFWWPKPNSTVPSQKLGYIMRVPGKEISVGTGIYDMKQDDIDRILKE